MEPLSQNQLLDAIVEAVYAEIDVPGAGTEWREGLRQQAVSARAAYRVRVRADFILDGLQRAVDAA